MTNAQKLEPTDTSTADVARDLAIVLESALAVIAGYAARAVEVTSRLFSFAPASQGDIRAIDISDANQSCQLSARRSAAWSDQTCGSRMRSRLWLVRCR